MTVLDNTLQQYVLFVIGTLALSVSLAPGQIKVIAAATIVFIVARFAFWIGYRKPNFSADSERHAHFFIFSRPMKSRLPSGTPLVRRMS